MEKNRAKEIANSPIMANVTYNGSQVYIQNVDENTGTANIYPLERPEEEQQVSVDDLIEH